MEARILAADGTVEATRDAARIRSAVRAGTTIWIEVEAETPDTMALLREDLALHALTIEDIWQARSLPKIDDFDTYLYVLIHGVHEAKPKQRRASNIALAELDIVIGKTFLVTRDPDNLVGDDIRAELARSPHLLQKGIPWLAHAVLDHAVDRYLPIIDHLDGEIETLQDDVLAKAGTRSGAQVLARILSFKRTLQELRRTSIHQREILLRLSRGEFDELPPEVLPFYRDIYDHFLRVNDITEGYRDLVTSALDAYLSVQSNRMNEIMKTLTLMSTVMLPLTFIAGVYGMNFGTGMPETQWKYGYPAVLALMVVVAASIVLWFRHKGWIGRTTDLPTEADPQ